MTINTNPIDNPQQNKKYLSDEYMQSHPHPTVGCGSISQNDNITQSGAAPFATPHHDGGGRWLNPLIARTYNA